VARLKAAPKGLSTSIRNVWKNGAQGRRRSKTHNISPLASTLLQSRVERVLEDLVNGVKPDSTDKDKLMATCEQVLNGWKATENAVRDQGLLKEADQVLEFIQKLPPVKTDHDVLKDKMLADQVRLQTALDIKPLTPEQAVTQGDGLTLTRYVDGKTVEQGLAQL
jgi:hypothetical protein